PGSDAAAPFDQVAREPRPRTPQRGRDLVRPSPFGSRPIAARAELGGTHGVEGVEAEPETHRFAYPRVRAHGPRSVSIAPQRGREPKGFLAFDRLSEGGDAAIPPHGYPALDAVLDRVRTAEHRCVRGKCPRRGRVHT